MAWRCVAASQSHERCPVSHQGDRGALAFIAAAVIVLSPHHHHHHHVTHHHHRRPSTPRAYARRLTLHRWRSVSEWRALDAIVRPESSWNPCAHYPSQHDCGYVGPSACGIPQANPCPYAWRGRLYSTRWTQVRWLLAYIGGRYGDPLAALAHHNAYGWY